ncbi:hypothetical protein SAMN04488003_11477 [Loktanella fryxellensis]|uniref:Uncharacterized protein n=1 Tax=Loktanella fryxellensis TaxID=245187 RepID=A0A1H8G2J7_9RHOB|nr:hypothetical protein [Loktanella fryxellensis]SEN37985.1 hypothetical protein SAMN04488003_11477 [Loktanella fryxellensis]
MDRQQAGFHARIRRILRHRQRLARGYRLRVDRNNLIVPQVQRVRLRFPWRSLAIVLLVGLGFKTWVTVSLDPDAYAARVQILNDGSILDRAVAAVMLPDPATQNLARVIGLIVRG